MYTTEIIILYVINRLVKGTSSLKDAFMLSYKFLSPRESSAKTGSVVFEISADKRKETNRQ